jgi:hypothetical protein
MRTMPRHLLCHLATATALALSLRGAPDAQAGSIYSDTILTTSSLTRATGTSELARSEQLPGVEGCLGKSSLFVVGSFSDAGDLIDSGVYDKDSADDAADVIARHLTFTFFLRQDQVDAILDSLGGLGILTVRAARDIGREQLGDGKLSNPTEFLKVTSTAAGGGEIALGNLFQFTESSCPVRPDTHSVGPGPEFALLGLLINNECGPHFDNDGPQDLDVDGKAIFGAVSSIRRARLPSLRPRR